MHLHLQILFEERDTYLSFYVRYCIGSCTLLIWDTPGSQRVQKQLGEKESYTSRAICLPIAGRVSRVKPSLTTNKRPAAAATHNRVPVVRTRM